MPPQRGLGYILSSHTQILNIGNLRILILSLRSFSRPFPLTPTLKVGDLRNKLENMNIGRKSKDERSTSNIESR